MAREISYKLGRYRITESPDGRLCWESHSGFGNTRTGTCFIEGNILLIGPAEDEKPGFLKREFMEQVERLPAWERTKYYCSSQAIYKCGTAERLSFSSEFRRKKDLPLHSPARKKVSEIPDAGQGGDEQFKPSGAVAVIREKVGNFLLKGGKFLHRKW
jgi:hypothetical protein